MFIKFLADTLLYIHANKEDKMLYRVWLLMTIVILTVEVAILNLLSASTLSALNINVTYYYGLGGLIASIAVKQLYSFVKLFYDI